MSIKIQLYRLRWQSRVSIDAQWQMSLVHVIQMVDDEEYKLRQITSDTKHKKNGSCVLKASVDRVSVDTIGRYSDRHSADTSTDTRPICRPSVGRVSVDMLF